MRRPGPVLIAATMLWSVPANAQQGTGSLPEPPQAGQGREDGGETGSDPAIFAEPIIVTGTARRAVPLTTPSDVDVIDGADKDRIASAGLGAFARRFAGVDSLSTGDQVGNVVIRGLSGNRVRVLSDELSLDFQQYGIRHPANIDPFIAERIEVVRGSSSILYGSDAIGGAVNVIPKRPPAVGRGESHLGGRATFGYQSGFRQTTAALTMEAADGPLGAVGTLVLRDSGGLVVPEVPNALETDNPRDPLVTGEVPFTDYVQQNWDVSVGYDTAGGPIILRWEAYRSDQNYVLPDPPAPGSGDPLRPGGLGQDLENDIVRLFGEFDLDPDLVLVPSLSYVRNLRIAGAGGADPVPRSQLPEGADIDILRENITARIDLKHGSGFAGLDGRIGAEAVFIDQESFGPTALTPGGTINRLALFALEEARFGRFIVNFGGRIDYIRTEADPERTAQPDFFANVSPELLEQEYTIVTGSLGAVYRVSDTFSLTGNLSRGFRAPTIFELFVNGVHGGVAAVQRGDPTLEAETSLSSDVSLRYDDGRTRFKITGYINDIDNFIFLADTGETNPGGLSIFQVDQQNAALQGFDVEASHRMTDWAELRGVVEYVDGELDDGKRVPLLPPLKFRAELELTQDRLGPARDAFFTVGVDYAAAQDATSIIEPFIQFDTPPPPFGTASTDSYALVDLQAGARFGNIDVTLGVENLLDEVYRDFLDTYKIITLGVGRNVTVSLSTRF
ncbi:TonB-dependent receptor [Erythrobacter sp. HL-111]|uniref:TonB-dependent receptor n=1 Tax=Erythrobacter sp. HL-111 TaxID=1798193 RepID=UPI0006D9F0BF|nr:TonB-dependent receptor [Erythrobacter sp. HL-111]KPP94433.1 MAG: TonB-dependent receptor [Erythrobacteraceae bacterium HL-111]SDS56636.1 iron complex outermembrane recepter protein [Erythrobacter sp. HL-111]